MTFNDYDKDELPVVRDSAVDKYHRDVCRIWGASVAHVCNTLLCACYKRIVKDLMPESRVQI